MSGGELGQRIVAVAVERVSVIPELYRNPVAAERVGQTGKFTCRG